MKTRRKIIVISIAVLLAALLIGEILLENTLQGYYHQAEQAELFENMSTGYGYTRRFATETHTHEILVRNHPNLRFAFWSRGLTGSVQVNILDKDGTLVYEQQGRNGSIAENLDLESGHYTIQLVFTNYSGSLKFGFSNAKLIRALPDKNYQYIQADPDSGFHWDYILYTPEEVPSPYLLVIPNNTGFEESDMAFHQASAQDLIVWMSSFADELGTPLLVPVFPRPGGELDEFYTHNLDRNALLMTQDGYLRLDLQLLAMVEDARTRLEKRQIPTGERFLMWGFSASGTFSDRFSLLHPERLIAVAAGGCTHSLPFPEYKGENLPYPIGTYDYKTIAGEPFDMQVFASLPRFLYKGNQDSGGTITEDENVYPADEYFELFVRAALEARLETYPRPILTGFEMTQEEEDAIKYRIYDGAVFVDEFIAVSEIYEEANLDKSVFRLYPGVGHESTGEMLEDVLNFFLVKIARERQ
ncbi:MAG: hypothetical protein JXA13_11660 [Anaerolineales bacterium]|nr:hypothetical protein [Anaerolineales bacterium]